MQSTPDPVRPEATADDLAALFAEVKAAERSIAKAVRLAGRLAASGVAEKVEGGPLDWAISMACRWTGADARTIVGAGETLQHLPTVARLFAQGAVSWGQVRRITAAARRLNIDERAQLDARVAGAIADYDGIDAFDPDHLCDAAEAAVEELRGARALERQERAAARDNFLAVQGRVDGGSTGYWSADAIGSAPILEALQAARPVPQATPDAERVPGEPTRQGRQMFDALRDIAAEYLAGNTSDLALLDDAAHLDPDDQPGTGDDAGVGTRHPLLRRRRRRPAQPLLVLGFDTSQVSISPTGTLVLNVPGPLPRVSAAMLEILARDADFRAVLFDGKRPLAVSAKLHAKDVPADVRFAVRARDAGDRWPGSRLPISRTEPHHIKHRVNGGTHDPDNLVSLARPNHTRVHDHGWQLSLNATTGELRATRRHRTWRSLPRSTGLPPAPDLADLPGQPTGDNPPDTLPF
jgi:hypothetical protein